jgi:hypothetical protein
MKRSSVMYFLVGLALLLLVSPIPAAAANQTVKVYAFDLNTRGGIIGGNVTVWFNQSDANYSVYTDPYGYAEYNEGDLAAYRLTITHPNYISYDANATAPANPALTAYLFPKASAGIIRFRFQDRMPGWNQEAREICIFYKNNMRLYQCMQSNETAQLLTQQEYILVPTIQGGDMLASPDNVRNFIYIYGGVILSGAAFLFAAIIILGYVTLRAFGAAWRNKK